MYHRRASFGQARFNWKHLNLKKNDWKMVFKTVQSRLPKKKNTWILSRRGKSLRNNLWSCERIHLTPTLHHNGTVVSGTTSNSLVPEGIPSKQKGGSVSGLWMDIYQKSCKGYHPKKSCQGYNSPLIIHYNRWIQ